MNVVEVLLVSGILGVIEPRAGYWFLLAVSGAYYFGLVK